LDVGATVLYLWFADAKDKTKEKILSYLVRVTPDPEWKHRLEMAYKSLEKEIAHTFPDSRVNLLFCGDKLLVCGQAKDIAEANYIIEVVRSNVPASAYRETMLHRIRRAPIDRLDHSTDAVDALMGYVPPTVDDYELSGENYVVNMLRVPGDQQVSLMITFVEVNRAAARSIGVNFNLFNNRGINYASNTTGNIVPSINAASFNPLTGFQSTGVIQSSYNNLPFALDNGQLQFAISALVERNYARTLEEPNLVTLNGQPASFNAGDLFPVPFVTAFANSGLQSVGFIPVGVQLHFTPFITDKDKIRLQISAEVSERDQTLAEVNIAGTAVPCLTTRNFQTTVELREGQTLAVAGLIENKLAGDAQRVPGFGDLPFFGRLFAFDHIHAEEEELVILITPELVHPMERCKVPPLPGCDIFEPGDCEFYLWGRIESRRDYDYRSPVMTDLARMCRYKRAEQIYIAGPHGNSRYNEIGVPPAVPVNGAPPPPHPLPPGTKDPAAPVELHPPTKVTPDGN